MAIAIEKISYNELIYEATHDEDTIRDAQIIEGYRQKGAYPSRDKMDEWGITESGFLLLTGAINTVPGGAASPLTEYLLSQPVDKALTESHDKGLTLLTMSHGSLTPTKSEAFRHVSESNSSRADGSLIIPSGYELRLTLDHAEESCGPSQGDSLNTRTMFVQNTVNFKDQLDQKVGKNKYGRPQLDVEIHAVEAYVGRQVGQMPGNAAFNIHDVSLIDYLYSTTEELRQQMEEGLRLPYDEALERFYDTRGLNNAIRDCIDSGRMIFGQACLDRRQGLSAIHPDLQRFQLEELSESIKQNRSFFRKALQGVDWPTTGWQSEGHSESPLVILNIGNDEMMTRLGLWSLRHGGALNRGSRYLVPTAPAIINLPEEMFNGEHPTEVKTFAKQITQLMANLDWSTYGMGINRSPFYIEIDQKMYEVADMPFGMQALYSEKAEKYVGNTRVPKWFLSDLKAKSTDMNPGIMKTFGTRSLGRVIR